MSILKGGLSSLIKKIVGERNLYDLNKLYNEATIKDKEPYLPEAYSRGIDINIEHNKDKINDDDTN